MKPIQQLPKVELDFHKRLREELSIYSEKIIQLDGSVTIEQIQTTYFLDNDKWSIDFLGGIRQFKEMVKNSQYSGKNIYFRFASSTINLEIKYIWYQKLFKDEWNINSLISGSFGLLSKVVAFITEEYPSLHSLLDLDIDKAEQEWLFWLNKNRIQTQKIVETLNSKEHIRKTRMATFLRFLHSSLIELTDLREEWEKDKWDVRILHNRYGIQYNKSTLSYSIDFKNIKHSIMRQQVKKYFKQRLLSKNNFSWSTAQFYSTFLPGFLHFIFSLEPNWTDLKDLKRSHIEKYIEWLHEYANKKVKRKNSHPESYVLKGLKVIKKFIVDIQLYEYNIAPEKNIRLLFFPEDRPKRRKKSIEEIDYIPDYVLEQLFTHINSLHKDIIPIIWIAFKTGLRISNVLMLTSDCLERLNDNYYIVTDIEKTYVKGHRIPIDEKLANILAVMIQQSKENSNQDNNPEGFIFIRYRGPRKGLPFSQRWVSNKLNELVKQKNITDENGNLFHFRMHQFRHTYAVKMLNGGADILTVQELLAHASPEMTLIYAKLLDTTKRKVFESVINQGVFSFDLNGEVQEIKENEDIPEDILQALWQDHKLNAMDNPYGTCHARLSGNCPYMETPPCLTCNGGSPCKDLAIGFSELDVQKYELLIKTTSRTVDVSKQHNREDMVVKHKKNLHRYESILHTIKQGNIIFGRQKRMKRKRGVIDV